jgi:hypothetical protein
MHRQIIAAGLLATAAATPAFAASDSFNRTTLGSDWVTVAGSTFIANGAYAGSDSSLANFIPAKKDNEASVLVRLNGTGLQFGEIVIGNAFIKIQSQNGTGTFDHAGFKSTQFISGTFFPLTGLPAVSTARLTARLIGTVATMEIDTNLDGWPEKTYTHDFGVAHGSGIGLRTYGPVRMDNLRTNKAVAATAAPADNHIDLAH